MGLRTYQHPLYCRMLSPIQFQRFLSEVFLGACECMFSSLVTTLWSLWGCWGVKNEDDRSLGILVEISCIQGGKADLKNYRAGKEQTHCFQNGMVEIQPVSLWTANKYRFKHATEVIIIGTLFNVYSIVIIIY